MFGDVSIEQAIELGLFVCGGPETVLSLIRRPFQGNALR